MTEPKPDWVKDPVFAVGDHVWLYPKKRSTERIRGKITEVKRYGTWGQTVLYDTDIAYEQNDPVVGLSAHWFKPVDVVILLAEVEHDHGDQAEKETAGLDTQEAAPPAHRGQGDP